MADAICSVELCDRALYTRGLCEPHYRRLLRSGSVSPETQIGEKRLRLCSVDRCERAATERGLCHGHYLRVVRTGELRPDRPLGRRVNTVCQVDGCLRRAELRELCRPHANRKRKHGDVQADKPIREVAGVGFDSHGYWHVPVPPELRHLSGGRTPYPEHRLVMAMMLGRPLFDDESVHHRNGDRHDSRPVNLELWTRWQPAGQRIGDRVRHALELLDRYAPELLAGGGLSASRLE
jgi:hypothetical protein